MKRIKIILGIVSALVLTFFLTGLIVEKVNYTVEIEIERPVEDVFALFTAPETLQKWMPEITSFEPIEEKEGKIGSLYTMVIDNQGQELKMTEKIIAYIPNEKITFLFDSNDMEKTDEFNFIAVGNNTKLVQNCSVNSKSYIAACLFPYFKGTFSDASFEYMRRLKKIVENTKIE